MKRTIVLLFLGLALTAGSIAVAGDRVNCPADCPQSCPLCPGSCSASCATP
jgi:hypothetical protein